MLQMHEYYTPNPIKLQGFLAIFTIFVDYADFYVNMIMLTVSTIPVRKSTFLAYKRTSWGTLISKAQNIDFASGVAKIPVKVNITYLL